jgi:uncharacterized membrane protein HdeD (DUF308 family)
MTEEIPVPDQFLTAPGIFPWWLLLVWGILTLLIGCMFLTTPRITTVLLITFMGAYWLVSGAFALGSLVVDRSHMGWKVFLSVINILAGILILLYPWFSAFVVLSLFAILIGIWAIFIGASHLYHGWIMKDAGNAVLGVISMIFGLLLLIYPFIVAALLPYVAGGFAIIFGIAAIYVSFVAKKCQEVPAACTP